MLSRFAPISGVSSSSGTPQYQPHILKNCFSRDRNRLQRKRFMIIARQQSELVPSNPSPLLLDYCLAIARFSRSSGLMKWSWVSLPRSICTQLTFPLNTLVWRV
jgi:hypothetical protein